VQDLLIVLNVSLDSGVSKMERALTMLGWLKPHSGPQACRAAKQVHYPVLVASTNVHETYEPTVCAVAMAFQVDRNDLALVEFIDELCTC
jgi:hypothetical protein